MRRTQDQLATALYIVVILGLLAGMVALASFVLGVGPLGPWLTELFGGSSNPPASP